MSLIWVYLHYDNFQLQLQLQLIFNKNVDYNRLARKIAIANLGGPVKRKIKGKERIGKDSFILITLNLLRKDEKGIDGVPKKKTKYFCTEIT